MVPSIVVYLLYSNLEYQGEILKKKSKSSFGCKFHDLKSLELGIVFLFLELIISLMAL